jgi:hypothetical protein
MGPVVGTGAVLILAAVNDAHRHQADLAQMSAGSSLSVAKLTSGRIYERTP